MRRHHHSGEVHEDESNGDITGRIEILKRDEVYPTLEGFARTIRQFKTIVVVIGAILAAGFGVATYMHGFAQASVVEQHGKRLDVIETRVGDMADNIKQIGHAVGAKVKE